MTGRARPAHPPMPDYDEQAAWYDATRGGEPRARAAAAAIASLLAGDGLVVDVAGGTGIVSAAVAETGREVLVLDQSHGMLSLAQQRLPGRVVRGDARHLPFADHSVTAVMAVWLLHLLDDSQPVIAEAARVLCSGGVFATTVDKASSHGYATQDGSDRRDLVTSRAQTYGFVVKGEVTFVGIGQGREGAADPTFTVLAFERGT